MADNEPTSRPENGEPGKPQAANLYHKQGRLPRSRMDGQPRTSTASISVEIGRPRRRSSSHNPFLHLQRAHLKKLGIVAGLMTALLFAMVKLVHIMSARDYHSAQSPAVPLRPVTTNRLGQITGVRPRPTVETNAAAVAPTKIETEKLMRAAYLARVARSLEDNNELDKAAQKYRDALEVWPYTPDVWAQLGRVYLRQRDYWHAQVALEKAVEGNPGSVEVLNNLGVAYLWRQSLEGAQKVLQAALDIDPNYSLTYFNLALCHLAQNDRPRARERLQQFLRMKPDDPRGLREMACLKALDNEREDALADLEHALAQAPDWPLLYFDAAVISALLGDFEKSIRYLEKAEPLSGPSNVYKIYQEPPFKELRLTEAGKLFEKDLATRAREMISRQEQPAVPTSSDPMISTPPPQAAPAP